MKKRRFFFHYNKPASQQAGHPVLTVHWQGACHLVKGVDCRVPCATRLRKQQPRCVMAGSATTFGIDAAGIGVLS